MLSATSPAASPSRSSTVTAAPARESLRAQARPMPLAAPVTRALRPLRSTSTDDFPGTIEASFMFLLHPEKFLSRTIPSPNLDRETSIGHIPDVVSPAVLEKVEPLSRRRYQVHTLRKTALKTLGIDPLSVRAPGHPLLSPPSTECYSSRPTCRNPESVEAIPDRPA